MGLSGRELLGDRQSLCFNLFLDVRDLREQERKRENQEPIRWSLHLQYKPLESTLSRVDL